MEDLLTQRLLGETEQTDFTNFNRIAEILDPTDFAKSKVDVQESNRKLVEDYGVKRINELLANPEPNNYELVQQIAKDTGVELQIKPVEEAALDTLASDYPPSQVASLFKTKAEKEAGKTYAIKRWKEVELEFDNAEVSEAGLDYDTGKVAGVAKSIGFGVIKMSRFVDAFMLPGFSARVGNILNEFDEEGGWINQVHGEDARKRINHLIVTLPKDQSEKLTEGLIAAVRETDGGWLYKDNWQGKKAILSELFSPLENGDPEFFTLNKIQPLEYLGLGLSIRGLSSLEKIAKAFPSVSENRIVKGIVSTYREIRGLDAMTPAWGLSDVVGGANNLVKTAMSASGTADASLARMGTGAGQVVESLVAPKQRFTYNANSASWVPSTTPTVVGVSRPAANAILPAAIPHGKPYLPAWTLRQSDIDAKVAGVSAQLQKAFSERLSDHSIQELDDGLDIMFRVGSGKGIGWATANEATAFGDKALTPTGTKFEVVKDALGNFQVQSNIKVGYGTDDVGKFVRGDTKGFWHGLGASTRFAEHTVRGSIAGAIQSAKQMKENRQLLKTMEDLDKVGQERAKNFLIQWSKNTDTEATLDDMKAANLTAPEIKAIMDAKQLFKNDLHAMNDETWQYLNQEGFKHLKWGQQQQTFAKEITELPPSAGHVVDLVGGKRVKVGSQNLADYRLFKFAEGSQDGYFYGIVSKKETVDLAPLPEWVVKPIKNYVPIYYNSPVFVREVLERSADGKVTQSTARHTARSMKSAEAWVAKQPAGKYEVYRAQELSEQGSSLDTLARIRERGLFVTSHRKPEALTDVDEGVENMLSFTESLDQLARNNAARVGLGKWILAQKAAFDNTYGKTLGWTLDLASPPPQGTFSGAEEVLYAEALRSYRHVRRVAGLEASGTTGSDVRTFRNWLADAFYDNSSKSGGVGKWFGDNISGLDASAVRRAKSAAATAYLTLNPIVQPFVQSGAIFSYLGVTGAAKYLVRGADGGSLLGDLSLLSVANFPERAEQVRKSLGMSTKRMEQLIGEYKASGLNQLIDEHIYLAGTVGNSRVASRSPSGAAISSTLNLLKDVGVDVGISVDKKVAWLVSRNRHLAGGGKLDAKGLSKVAQDAELITGNMNKSDPLVDPNGVASLFVQMKSYPIKQTARLLSAVTFGKVGREVGLSVAEQQRMVALSAVAWGAGGLGAHELVERLNTEQKWGLDSTTKLILREGLEGAAINAMFNIGNDEGFPEADEGEAPIDDTLMVAKRVAPFATSATWLMNTVAFSKALASWDTDKIAQMFPEPAALGPVGGAWDGARFVLALYGAGAVATPLDKALQTSEEFARILPAVSNWYKYNASRNLGMLVNQNGDPVVQATYRSRVAQLFGLPTYTTYGIMEARKQLEGVYDPSTGGDARDIDREVEHTFAWMTKLSDNVKSGELRQDEFRSMLDKMNLTHATDLEPHQFARFRDQLTKRIQRSGMHKDEALLDKFVGSEGLPRSTRDRIAGLSIPAKNQVLNFLDRQIGVDE